jgi:hypothetical protein
VAGGIDQAVAPSRHRHAGWRRTRGLRMSSASLLTRLASGLASEACERFGSMRSSRPFRRQWHWPCERQGAMATPKEQVNRSMARMSTNEYQARSNGIISPSTQVVHGLIIPRLEPF